MATVQVERMQTDAEWETPPILFREGDPLADVDASAWTFAGRAVGQRGDIDLATGGRMVIEDGKLRIKLSAADCAELGAGQVNFEVVRVTDRRRPVLIFSIENHVGLTT